MYDTIIRAFTIQSYVCTVTPSLESTSVSLALDKKRNLRESTDFAFDDFLRGFARISVHSSNSLFVISVVRTFSDTSINFFSINFFMAFVIDDVIIDKRRACNF